MRQPGRGTGRKGQKVEEDRTYFFLDIWITVESMCRKHYDVGTGHPVYKHELQVQGKPPRTRCICRKPLGTCCVCRQSLDSRIITDSWPAATGLHKAQEIRCQFWTGWWILKASKAVWKSLKEINAECCREGWLGAGCLPSPGLAGCCVQLPL